MALQLLGKGSFGSVYCVKRTADRTLHVMKKISIHNMPTKVIAVSFIRDGLGVKAGILAIRFQL